MKKLYAEIDNKSRQYIDYRQREDNWNKFEDIIYQRELRKVKLHLKRYYMGTMMTLSYFLKINKISMLLITELFQYTITIQIFNNKKGFFLT